MDTHRSYFGVNLEHWRENSCYLINDEMEGFVSVISIYKDFGESAFCFRIIKVQGSSQKSEKQARDDSSQLEKL